MRGAGSIVGAGDYLGAKPDHSGDSMGGSLVLWNNDAVIGTGCPAFPMLPHAEAKASAEIVRYPR